MATMNSSERIPVTLEFRGANLPDGSPGPVHPVTDIVWATSDATVLTADMDAGGLTGFITSVAAGGPARITVTADADTGATGIMTITGVSEDVTVTQDPATLASVVNFTLGPPVPKG